MFYSEKQVDVILLFQCLTSCLLGAEFSWSAAWCCQATVNVLDNSLPGNRESGLCALPRDEKTMKLQQKLNPTLIIWTCIYILKFESWSSVICWSCLSLAVLTSLTSVLSDSTSAKAKSMEFFRASMLTAFLVIMPSRISARSLIVETILFCRSAKDVYALCYKNKSFRGKWL